MSQKEIYRKTFSAEISCKNIAQKELEEALLVEPKWRRAGAVRRKRLKLEILFIPNFQLARSGA